MSRLEDAMKVSVLPGGGALARTDDQPLDLRQRVIQDLAVERVGGVGVRRVNTRIASRYVRLVFEDSGRNRRETCRRLGISYHTLKSYLLYPQRTRRSRTQVSA